MKKFKLELVREEFEADGKVYYVQMMPGYLRDAYDADMFKRLTKKNDKMVMEETKGVRMALLSRTIYDSNGQLVREDVLTNWPGLVLSELYEDAARLNKISTGAASEKAQDAEIKNDSPEKDGTGLPSA